MRLRLVARVSMMGLALAACGTDDGAGPELLDGFDPPAPGPGEVQIVSPIVRGIAPGADVTLCTYLPPSASLPEAADVVKAVGYQSTIGGHHAILYQARQPKAVDTHECTDDDMVNAILVAIAPGGEGLSAGFEIPDGLAFRTEAGAQFFVQTHWINTTDQPIDGQSAFNVKTQPVGQGVQPMSLFSWVDTDILIPAGRPGHERVSCTFERDVQFVVMGGHAHELGTKVSVYHAPAAGAETMLYDESWSAAKTFATPLIKYPKAQPFVVRQGDSLRTECDYMNTTGDDVQFPREMCGGFGFYFPGSVQLDCTDGIFPR